MINRTNSLTDDELHLTHRSALACGIVLVEGTSRIEGTMRRWRPLHDVQDATTLLLHLRLTMTQIDDFIEITHFHNPDLILARVKGADTEMYCLAITHAASNMLNFANKKNLST